MADVAGDVVMWFGAGVTDNAEMLDRTFPSLTPWHSLKFERAMGFCSTCNGSEWPFCKG